MFTFVKFIFTLLAPTSCVNVMIDSHIILSLLVICVHAHSSFSLTTYVYIYLAFFAYFSTKKSLSIQSTCPCQVIAVFSNQKDLYSM